MTARTAVLTTASSARLEHLERQQRFLAREAAHLRVIAWLDAAPPPDLPGAIVVHVPPGRHGLRVGAGRNAAAAAALEAGAKLLVLLDVDCLPGPDLLRRYAGASAAHPTALLCGPVTYLPEGCARSERIRWAR
ncbi:hypothetical protein [Arenivirga flava]|uniref:Glycosyltransferase n=1 Tax=Arenivirga flava TaxID=1930060 RepID=A0AA37UPC8_9MICO|nr:hypothetical protein [Arenivirga flava]GMA28671.1 hypothetical protein GCM10025874_19240 [Arenivirga flava]